ncbi:MAG: DUF190 domain-containing protein [Bacteroidales bacterium]|nr:DUF190 domain-containing protein [Bacteroidales bacterium]
METNAYSALKIYASSTDRLGSQLLYEHIVYLAREKGLCGATVYRGIMGYGASNKHISTSKFWELTEKLPVVIEIVDRTDVVEGFYKLIEDKLQKMQKGCLVTIGPVSIKLQKSGI